MSDVKAFQCPNCQQFINNLMSSCKFCSMPLDMNTVTVAVSNQDFVNEAYNSASNVRILAGVMLTCFFLSFIPFLGFIFGIIHWVAFIGVPIFLLYWAIRFSGLRTTDSGYADAKKYCLTALFMWLGYLAFRIVLFVLVIGGIMALSSR